MMEETPSGQIMALDETVKTQYEVDHGVLYRAPIWAMKSYQNLARDARELSIQPDGALETISGNWKHWKSGTNFRNYLGELEQPGHGLRIK